LPKKKPIYDPRLRELHFGNWEGKAWKDLPIDQVSAWNRELNTYSLPAGESVNDLLYRTQDFMDDLIKENQPAIIVTHTGNIRSMLSILLKCTAKAAFSFDIDPSSITKLNLESSHFKIYYINRVIN